MVAYLVEQGVNTGNIVSPLSSLEVLSYFQLSNLCPYHMHLTWGRGCITVVRALAQQLKGSGLEPCQVQRFFSSTLLHFN